MRFGHVVIPLGVLHGAPAANKPGLHDAVSRGAEAENLGSRRARCPDDTGRQPLVVCYTEASMRRRLPGNSAASWQDWATHPDRSPRSYKGALPTVTFPQDVRNQLLDRDGRSLTRLDHKGMDTASADPRRRRGRRRDRPYRPPRQNHPPQSTLTPSPDTAFHKTQCSHCPAKEALDGHELSCDTCYGHERRPALPSGNSNDADIWFHAKICEQPSQSLRSGGASSERRALQPGREADRLVAKIIGWVVVILIVIWIISNPTAAGTSVHNWITDIVSFFTHLARG